MYRSILMSAAVIGIAFAGTANAASPRPTPQAQLAKITAGRTAGKPVSCLRLNDIRSSRIINGTAIVYEGQNGTLYVNTPPSGASFLRDGLTLVTDTHSDQLCNVDIVRLVDMPMHMQAGSIGLGMFVPYARPHHQAVNS